MKKTFVEYYSYTITNDDYQQLQEKQKKEFPDLSFKEIQKNQLYKVKLQSIKFRLQSIKPSVFL